MRLYTFYAALAGFALTLATHLAGWLGYTAPNQLLVYLGIAIFPIWFFVVKEGRAAMGNSPMTPSEIFKNGYFNTFSKMLGNPPKWVFVLALICFYYTFLNFFLNFPHGDAENLNGVFVLTSHGRVIKTLTEAEFHEEKVRFARFVSGHLFAFYAFAVAALFPKKD